MKANEKYMVDAIDKYEKSLSIKSDKISAIHNLGLPYALLGRIRKDEECVRRSFEIYSDVLSRDPKKFETLVNWGTALVDLGELKRDKSKFIEGFEKFRLAMVASPANMTALYNWGGSLLRLWHLHKELNYLDEALAKLQDVERRSGISRYNMACVLALRGDEIGARKILIECRENGTLPSKGYLLGDLDFSDYRETEWFQELMSSLS